MTEAEKREMLELAAKAAGVRYDPEASKPHPTSGAFWGLWLRYDREPTEHDRRHWNPLTDDGDEARLEAHLRMTVQWFDILVLVGQARGTQCFAYYADFNGDMQAARRWAGTRAAAEIGRRMQAATR